MKKINYFLLSIFISIFFYGFSFATNEDDIYKKIDLFSEVLDKINKEYVEDVNQGEVIDSAIQNIGIAHQNLNNDAEAIKCFLNVIFPNFQKLH